MKPFPFLLLAACFCTAAILSHAQEPAKSDSSQASGSSAEKLEAQFVATFTNATLSGRSCTIKDGQLGSDKEDRYTILSVTKLGGDRWQINARLSSGEKTMDVPIPARVVFAADAAVLLVDGFTPGGDRTYSARLLIHGKSYAGTWSGGDHGGLLGGLITNAKP